MSEVMQIISRIESGNPAASKELLPRVYAELHKVVEAQLVHEVTFQRH